MNKATILIVEDEVITARDLQENLQNLGYTVPATASSGDEAFRLIEQHQPDLVLMDIVIKGEKDGIKTALDIKKRFDIPVIYLTAYADEKMVERAKITSPFGYIIKPYRQRELEVIIEISLNKAELENKLRESKEWFVTTLKSVGDAVIATDANGRIQFMNPVAESLTGWNEADALGLDLQEVFRIINEKSFEKVENPVNKVLREGVIVGLANHTSLIKKTGETIPIDDSAAPIRNSRGKIIGVVLVFRDITERRKAELELAVKIEQLETFSRVSVGRELAMKKMEEESTRIKNENKALEGQLHIFKKRIVDLEAQLR